MATIWVCMRVAMVPSQVVARKPHVMQVPVSPKQVDSSLSGLYVLLCVEHVLHTCRPGLRWDGATNRPLVMLPPQPHRPVGATWTPVSDEALVLPKTRFFFGHPVWFRVGDAHALKAVQWLKLLYKWVDAQMPLAAGLDRREVSEAESDLPEEVRGLARSVAYASSLKLHCVGSHPCMQ